jgi:CRP-like cAMP-binding protein
MGAAKPAPDAQLRNRARTEQEYEQRTRRIALLRTLDCLHTVPLEELEYLVGLCTLRGFLAYETIVEAGNQGRYLYVLLQGSVRLTLRDREGNEVLLGMLSRGDVYGEESLFGTFFRRMGAYCETHCYVLQLPLADVRALLPAAPALHKVLQRVYQQRLAECTLARVPLFSHLTPTERLALLPLLKARHFPRDTEVMRQGEQGEALCLIESGRLLVQRDGDTISLMDEGDFCGEMALLSDKCHTATVRTLTPTDALMLPASEFHQLLGKRPNLARRFEQMLERRRAMDASLADDRQRVERLELARPVATPASRHARRAMAMCGWMWAGYRWAIILWWIPAASVRWARNAPKPAPMMPLNGTTAARW